MITPQSRTALSLDRLVGFQPDTIIDGIPQTLFAAEIALSRLNANVSKQELDLLQFAASFVAQPSTPSPQIVRRDAAQIAFVTCLGHHTPDHLGTEPMFCNSPRLVNRSEYRTERQVGHTQPGMQHRFYPIPCYALTLVQAVPLDTRPLADSPLWHHQSGHRGTASMATTNLPFTETVEIHAENHGVAFKTLRWVGVLMLVLFVGLPIAIYSRVTGDKNPWAPYEGD